MTLSLVKISYKEDVGVASKNKRTKPIFKRGNEHCCWYLLYPPVSAFSFNHLVILTYFVNEGVISGVGRKLNMNRF